MSAAPLDLRGLEPPEPLERTLDALDFLTDGDALVILLEREPHPLYRILQRNGYRYEAEWRTPGCCAITIRRAA
ncbi:DUF2249 domain-containing protein [Massilia arenosa]|uniref:DUF2249 domain-containing protein n=1 Tax=Zemynaea arenosa TaxID=2561931 RepID=A0A4Y9SFV9_9BURK|nr:DUF2249 domain-containing protein [Massilia arenosa]TFW22592.1 DUF2249 domain-containing protein [Massilia arenosa]